MTRLFVRHVAMANQHLDRATHCIEVHDFEEALVSLRCFYLELDQAAARQVSGGAEQVLVTHLRAAAQVAESLLIQNIPLRRSNLDTR